MGDAADMALERLYDLDELAMSGEIDPETGEPYPSPFMRDPTVWRGKPSGPGPCPICKGPTHPVNGKNGRFYGCNAFPKCKGSRNIERSESMFPDRDDDLAGVGGMDRYGSLDVW